MQDSQNRSNNQGGGGGNRRRRYRGGNRGHNNQASGNAPSEGQNRHQTSPRPGSPGPKAASAENRNRAHQSSSRRRGSGRVLTTNQVLVKYDNLLEQHLITRRKYYDYFNRVDERQLMKLEKNFYDSIEHLRRFEAGLEPWQREALEKRKTERYKKDYTYSLNHGLNPEDATVEVAPEEIEDPHFKESQKEAFEEYKDDTEESVGTYEDYLKLKGQA